MELRISKYGALMTATRESPRERLVKAAFALFAEQGYDGTTVEDIAQRAGVGRSTFFRTFGSKEDVIFPNHDELLGRIEERLAASAPGSRTLALSEAARLPLRHYVDEGDVARRRYELTRAVPTLKAREIAGLRAYQALFARVLRTWWTERTDGALRAELVAAGIVTAHNHVLRNWLRGLTTTPERDLDEALRVVLGAAAPTGGAPGETTVVVVRGHGDPEAVAEQVRAALSEPR